jgi:hypothetical protein
VISGGNVEPGLLAEVLAGSAFERRQRDKAGEIVQREA